MFDLAIKNGSVIDPSSRIQAKLNVGVKNGRIAAVTMDEITGSTEIDAEGAHRVPGLY